MKMENNRKSSLEQLFESIYKGRKVMVTGHTGFKGSWLVLWLKEMGAEVCGYSLSAPTQPNHISLLNLDIDSTIADVRDKEKIYNCIMEHKPEIVFHLAAQALVSLSYKEPVETFTTNVIGTLNVLDACRKAEFVKACVVVTSDKVYENREWVWGYRETDPFGGYDPYSASKGCTEVAVASYRRSFLGFESYGKDHNMLVATARAGNVIGGGDWAQDRLIPDIVRAAGKKETVLIRSPGAVRPWQHVLECLSGYLTLGWRLLRGRYDYAEGWNFGPPDEGILTVAEILREVQDLWPAVEYTVEDQKTLFHEAHFLKLDCCKARGMLGWKPFWSTTKAVEKTITWYRDFYESGRVKSREDICEYVNEAVSRGSVWTLFS